VGLGIQFKNQIRYYHDEHKNPDHAADSEEDGVPRV
jgi:hypothetical protein